jgi:L-alanine-DL-glutamate epimerase-like enolase superfamily enzyme
MKITQIRTHLLTYEYKPDEIWSWAGGRTLRRNAVFVRVGTDEGIEGYGEIGETAFLPQSVKSIVEEQFVPLLVGEDPLNIERLWHRMYMRSSHWGRKGVVIPIISGLDIALWDIAARFVKQPLYRILGGACRERVRLYASAGMEQPLNALIEDVGRYREQGYTAVKIRIGSDLEQDLERIRALRQRFGGDLDIMADAGQCYTDRPWTDFTAIRVARKLEPFDLFWLEEPLHPDNLEGFRRLCAATTVPIATGENEFTRFGFQQLLWPRAVDIVQPDVTRAGGISECKKIAALASAFQLPCAPHVFGSAVGLMANLHFVLSTANCIVLEHDRTVNPLRDSILAEPLEVDNGTVRPPAAIGLGVHLDEDIESRYPFIPEGQAVDKESQKRSGLTGWLES